MRWLQAHVHSPGVLLALSSAFLFGASVPFSKVMLSSMHPWVLAGLLYVGSGIGLSAWVLIGRVAGRERSEASLSRENLPWLIGAVFFGGILGPVLLMLGLSYTTASAASLLLNLESLATMAIAWVVFRENVDRKVFAGAMAIFAGAVVLSWQGSLSVQWGNLAIAGACLCWGIDNNLTRKISGANPVIIAAIKGLGAGPVNLVLGLFLGATLPAAATLAGAAGLGLVTYGISLVLFILALRHLGTARTAAYYGTAPFAGAVISIILLGEPLSGQLAAAGLLMAIGVWLHLSEMHEHTHSHLELEHEHRHIHDEHHRHEHGIDDPSGEPHSHRHRHAALTHRHVHYPDLHHRHDH
jgi:drug/metabolite transporter (DMT)-like permease